MNPFNFGSSKPERYALKDKIGSGAYGEVWKAKDVVTGKIVALKKIKVEVETEGIPSSALREIAILKSLNHPNIVKLLDVIAEEGKLYLIFEYCKYDLRSYILKNFPNQAIPENEIKDIMKQILSGVYYCHSNRVLHRDLKPANILVTEDGTVKIADFGLSRFYSIPVKKYSPEIITVWYRGPEILLGVEEYGSSTDIWSVGCIFGELFKKFPLFTGDCEIGQLLKIFEMLGTPQENEWVGVTKLKNYLQSFPKFKRKPWENILKSNPSLEAIDLMEKMLTFNPVERIPAKIALLHPFLSKV